MGSVTEGGARPRAFTANYKCLIRSRNNPGMGNMPVLAEVGP